MKKNSFKQYQAAGKLNCFVMVYVVSLTNKVINIMQGESLREIG